MYNYLLLQLEEVHLIQSSFLPVKTKSGAQLLCSLLYHLIVITLHGLSAVESK